MRIVLENICKDFKTGVKKRTNTLFVLSSFLKGRLFKKKWRALDNISLSVAKGELLGVIGENGSGKSTLLRVIAGIYPCEGKLYTEGKIVSLIGLGVGLNTRLSVRDNIFLLHSFFDVSRKETKKRIKSMLSFAGLEGCEEEDLYKLSSGMLQRLFFSIAMSAGPDILLLDEVFEVGDEGFKKKSQQAIKKIIQKGGSAVLVSHDLDMIENNCDRVVWLSRGSIVMSGLPKEVIEKYRARSLSGKQAPNSA